MITPGILEDFSSEWTCLPDRKIVAEVFDVFVFGRGSQEDLELKGYDIIGNAVASLGETFQLKFVGSPPGQHKAVTCWFQNKSKLTTEQLTVRVYCTRNEVRAMLNEADVVALPSRTEGFGLVAVEALSAGVPILVSNQSGIAKALEKVEGGNSVIVHGGTGEWVDKIKQLSKQTTEKRLISAMRLRETYRMTYPWKTQIAGFEGIIRELVGVSSTNGTYIGVCLLLCFKCLLCPRCTNEMLINT